MAKFKFSQSDLDELILKALNGEPTEPQDKTAKPNVLQKLLARKDLITGKAPK